MQKSDLESAASVSPAERCVRTNLAALYRLCLHYGWDSHIFNHIAARVPGENCFLVKPHDLMFQEVKASNLIKLRFDGELVGDYNKANAAAFTIHSAALNSRSDVNYTMHVHTNAGVAMSAQRLALLPFYQRSMVFYNRLSYHDFEGIADDMDEASRLARDLGPTNKAVILRNHGLLTAGAGPSECLTLMRYLVESCEIQLMLQQGNSEIIIPPADVCERTAKQYERVQRLVEEVEWAAYIRHADSIDASYRD